VVFEIDFEFYCHLLAEHADVSVSNCFCVLLRTDTFYITALVWTGIFVEDVGGGDICFQKYLGLYTCGPGHSLYFTTIKFGQCGTTIFIEYNMVVFLFITFFVN